MNIIIVDDEQYWRDTLTDYVTRYNRENDTGINVRTFSDAFSLFVADSVPADIIFMDIDMPGLNGMDAAKRLREFNTTSCLIFVTCMAQYALEGYSVSAFDFIVKPLSYERFCLKLKKAIRHVDMNPKVYIDVHEETGIRRIPVDSVGYVEVAGHHLMVHTADSVTDFCGSLKNLEPMLPSCFVRINRCYIVNLNYITQISNDDTTVLGDRLQISRGCRKALLNKFSAFLGGTPL